MAKREAQELKKGEARFSLVGKAKINDYTFSLDNESASKYVYSTMKLGVDCGDNGTIFAEMMGGYSNVKNNVIYVHGKKLNADKKEVDDYQNRFEIDWHDRLDEGLHDDIGDNCFITIGIEKDSKDKTYYKKFLSAYDAIEYCKEHLEDDMIIRVSGELKYSMYEDRATVKREINQVVLSSVKVEDHKAHFYQTLLVDQDSVGKLDKETGLYPITAYVVDYVGKPKIDNVPVEIKKNAVFPRTYWVEDKGEKTTKLLKMMFGAKKDSVWEIAVEGEISKGGTLVTATLADLPEDIQELVELEVMTEQEAIEKCVGRGSSVENWIVKRPKIKKANDDAPAQLVVDKDKYKIDDYVTYSQLLESVGVIAEEEDNDDDSTSDDDIDALLDELE